MSRERRDRERERERESDDIIISVKRVRERERERERVSIECECLAQCYELVVLDLALQVDTCATPSGGACSSALPCGCDMRCMG